jgi:hypothetical protein
LDEGDSRAPAIDVLRISSDPMPDGSYALVLSVGEDHSRTLRPVEAIQYGRAVFTVANTVDYEQSLYRQLVDQGAPWEIVMITFGNFRQDRPSCDDEVLAPLRWVPCLTKEGVGYIQLEMDGVGAVGQIDVDAARVHAACVIESASNAELDAVYRRLLGRVFGTPDDQACLVVEALSFYRYR